MFSKMGPKIGPRPFPEQFRASKRAPEISGQKIKRSHGGLFWPSNFWAILAVPRVVPLGNSGTVPGQLLLGMQSRNTTKCSSEIIIGPQQSTLVVRNQHWSSEINSGQIFLGSPKKVPNTLKMFVIGHGRDHNICARVCAACVRGRAL